MDRRFRQPRPFRARRRGGPLIGAIWMFGLAYLAFSHNWWPGILILIGISILANVVLGGAELAQPQPLQPPTMPPPPPSPATTRAETPTPFSTAPAEAPRPARVVPQDLPERCPNCGGPTGASAPQSGAQDPTLCHYCGSRLVK